MTDLDSRSAPETDRARATEEGLDPSLMDALYEAALIRGGPLALELDAWRRGRRSLPDALGRAFLATSGQAVPGYRGGTIGSPPPSDYEPASSPNGHRPRRRVPAPADVVASNTALRAALSPREREVVSGLERGHRVGAIAEQLGLSHHTVRNHLKSVFHKMRVTSQVELLAKLRDSSAD